VVEQAVRVMARATLCGASLAVALGCAGLAASGKGVGGDTSTGFVAGSAAGDALWLWVEDEGGSAYVDAQGRVGLRGPMERGTPRVDAEVFWVRGPSGVLRIDRSGDPILVQAGPSGAALREDLGDGFALIKREDGKVTVLDPTGRDLVPEGLFGLASSPPREIQPATWPLPACVARSRCGFLARDGQWVVAPAGDVAPFNSANLGLVLGDDARYVDKRGQRALGPFQVAHPFSDEGLALIETEQRPYPDRSSPVTTGDVRVIDRTGAVVGRVGRGVVVGENDPWDDLFSSGRARLWSLDQGGYGFVDRTGRWVIPAAHVAEPDRAPRPFSEGLAAVWRGDGFVFVDVDGATVIPGPFPAPRQHTASGLRFSEGLAPVPVPQGWAYIDRAGVVVAPGPFSEAEGFRGGLARVCGVGPGARCGFVRADGSAVAARSSGASDRSVRAEAGSQGSR
jgi:hypothetical protein